MSTETNVGEAPVAFDLIAHLQRQQLFSLNTFGPGIRTAGVSDHIRKELLEIEKAPADVTEWVDVILLAFDGAWRCGASPEQIASAIAAKQTKNECRNWPDWRTADPNKAIEHVKAIPGEQERVETERETVVLGDPQEEDESWPDDDPRRHNCDAMGCGRSHVLARIKKGATAPAAVTDEPVFWYRPRSDGGYEGPIHNASIENVRKRSSAWVPLYTRPAADVLADAERIQAIPLPKHEPTIAIEEILAEYSDDDRREEVWESITAYADIHARAAIDAARAKEGGAA
ncbi:MAG: hypothetical protein CGU28_17150 [Candidatus Dactylopiibacterium carminicum]|nr:MAG: hypothetical protein CGU28_17150 [Candidatus Dactylopiibacterium carminicum]